MNWNCNVARVRFVGADFYKCLQLYLIFELSEKFVLIVFNFALICRDRAHMMCTLDENCPIYFLDKKMMQR